MKKLLLLSTILLLLSMSVFAQETTEAAPGATLCADETGLKVPGNDNIQDDKTPGGTGVTIEAPKSP